MSNRNQVTGSFATIADFDANTSLVTGIHVGNLVANGSNISFGNLSNMYIPGGLSNQFIRTDGNGNLSWQYGGVIWDSGFSNSTVSGSTLNGGVASFPATSPIGTAVTDYLIAGSVISFVGDNANLYTITGIANVVLNTANIAISPTLTRGFTNNTYINLANIVSITSINAGNNITFTANSGNLSISTVSNPNSIYFGNTSVNIPTANGDIVATSKSNVSILANANIGITSSNGNISTTTSNGNISVSSNGALSLSSNNANLALSAGGTGLLTISSLGSSVGQFDNNKLYINRGSSAITSGATDEFLALGSNTQSSSVILTLNAAPSQYTGIRHDRNGVQQWFNGIDNTSASGNYVIQAPAGALYGNALTLTSSGVSYTTSGYLYYTATTIQNVSSNTTYYPTLYLSPVTQSTAGSTDTEANVGISYDSTNHWWNVNANGLFIIQAIATFSPNSAGYRQVSLSNSGGTTFSRTTTPGTLVQPTGLHCSTTVQLVSGDRIYFNIWQNSGGNLPISPYGNVGTSTVINFLRL